MRLTVKPTSALIAALALGVAACTGSSGTVSAQSFNCSYAKTADEVLICQSPELARMDSVLASNYADLRGMLNSRERAWLQNEQRGWLRARMSCGYNYRCVYQMYARRWDEIITMAGRVCYARRLECLDLGGPGDGSIKMTGPL
jgi:uncharacterized protein